MATAPRSPSDVLVSSVTASPDPANQGDVVTISIDVANHGNDAATFTVTANVSGPGGYAATGTTADITLSSGASTVVRFSWVTSAAPAGSYTITGTQNLPDGDDTNDSASTGLTLELAGEEEEPNCPPNSNSPKCR